jgi:hypothetical protein
MELDKRLFAVDGNGIGVALGDRDKGRFRLFGLGRTVVLALAALNSLAKEALDRPRGFTDDFPGSEERVVDRERRVDVSDGVLVLFGGILCQASTASKPNRTVVTKMREMIRRNAL